MDEREPIRCRVAACPEALDDGKSWSFYLINDSGALLDSAELYSIGYEWGGAGNSESPNVRVIGLVPGGHALIWRDDGSGADIRMDLSLRVHVRGRELQLNFEFPKLYLRELQMIDSLGKPGWQVAAEA